MDKYLVHGKLGGFVGIRVRGHREFVEVTASTFITDEDKGNTVVVMLTGSDAQELAYKLMAFAATTSTV